MIIWGTLSTLLFLLLSETFFKALVNVPVWPVIALAVMGLFLFQVGQLAAFLRKPHEHFDAIGMPDFGLGEDERLTSASRAHGNLSEHAPIVIILVGLLELSRADHMGLLAVAGTFLLARVLHAIGLYMKEPEGGGPPWPRAVGVVKKAAPVTSRNCSSNAA